MFYRDYILNEAGESPKILSLTVAGAFKNTVDMTPKENVPTEFADVLLSLAASMRKEIYKQDKENKVFGAEPKIKKDKAKGKLNNHYTISFSSTTIERRGQEDIIRKEGFTLGKEVNNKKTKWHGKNITNYGNWLYKYSSDKEYIFAILLASAQITTYYYGVAMYTTFTFTIYAFCLDNTEENIKMIK